MELDDAIDEAMEKIRESHFLTDAVTREASIEFLMLLTERCHELAGEITCENRKAVRRPKVTG